MNSKKFDENPTKTNVTSCKKEFEAIKSPVISRIGSGDAVENVIDGI
jgi:hypothetical protein